VCVCSVGKFLTFSCAQELDLESMTRSMLLRLNGRTANEDDVWAVTEQPYPGEKQFTCE
jgi:hypothetical protein